MNVLILGGTGTMGRYLVEYLSGNKENQIYITSRKKHSSSSNIHFIEGNAHDIVFLTDLLKGKIVWDSIVDFMIYKTNEFKERRDVLLNGTKQYVFLSSARVYANSNEPITEASDRLIDVVDDDLFLSSDKYAISKAREENLLIDSEKKNWTIIRPYITYSNVRFQLGVYEKEDWLYRALKGRSIVFSKDLANKNTTITFGGDVSKGISAILGKEEALGEIFHITSSETSSWDEILNIYTKVLKEKGFDVSVIFVNKTADIINQEEKVKYDRIYNRIFDNSKINEFIDISKFIKQSEGIELCLKDFLNNPEFKSINWISQAQMDKIAGEKTKLSEISGIKDKVKYLTIRYLIDIKLLKKLKKSFGAN